MPSGSNQTGKGCGCMIGGDDVRSIAASLSKTSKDACFTIRLSLFAN